MTIEKMVVALAAAALQLGIKVRFEAGNFRGGDCVMKEARVIVLNKRHPAEMQFSILANSLRSFDLEELYLKPVVRIAVEKAWKQSDNVLIELDEA